MDALLSKLDVATLIKKIQVDVEQLVSTHLEEKFALIAAEIATNCNQDESKVIAWIQTAVNMEKPVVKRKVSVKPEHTIPCSANTKAGTPCKYKCSAPETLCKKHKKMQDDRTLSGQASTSQLPVDEQDWLSEQTTYKQTFFPKYENSELTMDEDIVDDSVVVTHE